MSRPRRWIVCLALAAFAACSDAERPLYVTEHLKVELYDDEVICGGTLAAMDAQMERVAAFLGVELPEMTHVYYGPSAVDQHCGERWYGCARGPGIVAATSSSIFHELVHTVRQNQGGGAVGLWLFEEGLAEVLSGFRWDAYRVIEDSTLIERGPAVLAEFARGQGKFVPEDYPIAGHFMSWMRTTYGDASLVAFLNDERYLSGEAAEAAFVDQFGLSIAGADNLWRASSALDYRWEEPCDPSRTLSWEGSVLEFTDSVDCDASHTIGPADYGTITLRSHCFTLSQAGMLQVEVVANGGTVGFVPVDCVDTGEFTPGFYDYKSLKGGEAQDLPFAACTWEVTVRGGGPSHALDFTLRLTKL